MKVKYIVGFIILMFGLVGCSSGGSGSMNGSSGSGSTISQPQDMGGANRAGESTLVTDAETLISQRVIIYTGEMELLVKDVPQAMAQVTELAAVQGGYVSASNIRQTEYSVYGTVTIRVDAKRYLETVVKLREIGLETLRENTTSQDVTAEFVDLEARKTNLGRTEEALQKILERHEANNEIDDILKVHQELTRVRGEIEQIEGRLRYLQNQAALATITINLSPEEHPQPIQEDIWQPTAVAQDAFETLVDILQGIGDWVIWGVICGLPLLILVLIPLSIPLLITRFLYKSFGKTKTTKLPKTDEKG